MLAKSKIIIKNNQKGFAAVLATLLILGIASAVAGTLTLTTLAEQKITKNSAHSIQAYYASESGIEDSLYRVLKGKNYQATNSLSIGSSTALISISGGNDKVIRVNGEENNRFRDTQVNVKVSTAIISFYYGVQVGEGGLTMSNGSKITGNIYSNGPIRGANISSVTGDAWVANLPGSINQQSTVVSADFVFGKEGGQIDAAQSFIPSASDSMIKISLYLKKIGNPPNKTVRILTDNNNKPSKNLASSGAYGTLDTTQISQNNFDWIDVIMTTPPSLINGTKYWVVIDTAADSDNYLAWGDDTADAYGQGTGKYSPNWNASSPTWTNIGGDLAFKAWLGNTPNSLDSLAIGGNAHANTINNCSVAGDAYYQTITSSAVSGTSYPNSPDPTMENMPISDSNIADWKTEATAGGMIDGSYSASETASLGPKKIKGDLNVANGAELIITGTIYVTGNINVSNNAKIRLGANYGNLSGLILTDGTISISNNTVFSTNEAGAYLMMLSTKSGNAINLANNSNTVIFYASSGTVTISNNAVLKEVTAYQIDLANNAQVVYESGLASAKFSSGSGAGWAVHDWQEVP